MLRWFQFEYMFYINNYQTEGNHLKIFGTWTVFHFFCIQKEAFHFISRLCQVFDDNYRGRRESFFYWTIDILESPVKRHLISTTNHKHSSHAESNLEQRFLRSREKSDLQSNWQGPKLYSKVLTIEPNRLLIKYFLFDKGA